MSRPASPFTAAQMAATRQPVDQARQLPARAFVDPAVFAWEQEAWFARDWICVGRADAAADPGTYMLAEVAGERLVLIRGRDAVLRAFHNVCRHRGATLLEAETGRLPRIQCPYHAWTYGLDGRLSGAPHTERLVGFEPQEEGLVPVRCATWQGFAFVSLAAQGPSLEESLADLPAHLEHLDLAGLRCVRRIDYEVAADWKVVAQNYSECLHCPGVHPQLNRITPYDVGQNFVSAGPWAGGFMCLAAGFETLSSDGLRHGRPALPGWSAADEGQAYYLAVWPNLLLSVLPDYAMTHQVWPLAAGRSRVRCEWLFPVQAVARPDFDPSAVIDFWDLTNRQDWHVCELVQQGLGSRAYVPGRYTLMEDMVHAFDLLLADRYAADGRRTRFAPRADKWIARRR
ncbi:MAG TPA: aromatic ring-hydroxylating dioxygenase subunit alpha [Candidatus Limnocylindrales bacterium]|nr:aromatic ring-hydroxylating dioxygenase subunit alpha [Candidatus Limnocylindrales bacterium]